MSLSAAEPACVSRALGLVAASLDYPEGSSAPGALDAAERTEDLAPEISAALRRLSSWLASAPPGGAEERYSGLFDLSPVCTLHLGYHLFGESYQRGALLSGLVVEMRKAGVVLRDGELSDYLPAVLRLLASLPAGEDRETLVDALLLPGLTRQIEALEGTDSPWADVLRALPSFLAPLGGGQPLPPPDRVDEIDLEAADLV